MKDLFNTILNPNSPLFGEIEKMLEDPNVPVKHKAQLLAVMGLSELKGFKEDGIVEQLPLIIEEGVAQAKAVFAALPEVMLKAQIASGLGKLSPDDLEERILAGLIKARAKKEAKKAVAELRVRSGKPPKVDLNDEAVMEAEVEAYMADSVLELSDDEFVALFKGIRQVMPTRFQGFMDAIVVVKGAPSDVEGMILHSRDRIIETGKVNQDSPLDEVPVAVLAKAMSEVAAKVNPDSVYVLIKHIVDGLDTAVLSEGAVTGVGFAEDFLTAMRDGNMFKLKDTANANTFARALGVQTQLIEDAVVAAGILPDTDIVAAYQDVMNAKGGVAPKPKAKKVAGKPLKPYTPK